MPLRITSLIVFLFAARLGFAQCLTPQKDFFVPDGQGAIIDITSTPTGDTVFMAGSFTSISRFTGNICQVDKGNPSTSVAMPMVSGEVSVIVSDKQGGWFIAGEFTEVNNVERNKFAHINSNGEVQPLIINTNGTILDIYVTDNRIYVAGTFTTINNVSRNYVAALNHNGSVLPWNPDANGSVYKVLPVENKILMCGSFSSVGGFSRQYLSKVDSSMALPDTWNANISSSVYDFIKDDSLIYIAGSFNTVGGVSKTKVAAIRYENASLYTGYTTSISTSGAVTKIAMLAGNLYIGGDFTSVNSSSRQNFAVLNKMSGSLLPLNISFQGAIKMVKVFDNDVYVGGAFLSVNNNKDKKHIIRFSAQTGTISNWDPLVSSDVYTIADNGTSVVLGGSFKGFNRSNRNNLVAVKLSTLEILPWNPRTSALSSSNYVSTVHFLNDKVIIGGFFDSINGVSRKKVGMIDMNANVTSWDPEANGTVTGIESYNGVVYLVGAFTNIGGLVRTNFAAINEDLGNVLPFTLNHGANIRTIKVYNGALYVTGEFTQINGNSRAQLAKFNLQNNPANPTITTWNPQFLGSNDYVMNMEAAFGKIYLNYYDYQSSTIKYYKLVMIDTLTGGVTNIMTNSYANSDVGGIAADNSNLYISYSIYNSFPNNGYVDVLDSAGNVRTRIARFATATARMFSNGKKLFVYNYSGVIANEAMPGVGMYNLTARPEIIVSKPLDWICSSDTITLTSSSATGNYWYMPGNTGYGQQFVLGKSSYSRYSVDLTAPVAGCPSAFNSVYVIVRPGPNLQVDALTVNVCKETGADIRTYYNDPKLTFLWSTGQTDSLIHADQEGKYTVTATDTMGCKNSLTVTVNHNYTPQAPAITSLTGKFTVCGNDSLQIRTGYQYNRWSHGPTTSTVYVKPGKYAVYTKNGSSPNACNSDTSYVEITGFERAEKPVIIAAKSGLCGTDSVMMTVDIQNIDSLVWSDGTKGKDEIYAKVTGKYYVVNQNQGCNSVSDTFTIKNNKAATPVVTANRSTSFCEGGSVILTSSHTGNNVWNNGATTKSITVTTGGLYKVVAVVEACNSDSSDRITVTVNPLPPTPIIAFSADSAVVISNSLTGNQWYRNNGIISGAVNFQYSLTQAGTYHTIVTNTFGCKSAKSNELLFLNTGLATILKDGREISIYPNPTSGMVYLDGATREIRIFNMEGKLVREEKQFNVTGEKHVDLSGFENGLYLLQVIDQQGNSYYSKIVKQ